MRSLRKEDTSLYLYIKDVVLRDFVETIEYAELTLMPELCGMDSYVYEINMDDMIPSPRERGRGLVYFDSLEDYIDVNDIAVDLVSLSACSHLPTVSGINGDGDYIDRGTPEQSRRITVYEHAEPILCTGVPTTSGIPVDWREYMIDYVDGRIITTRELTNPSITYTWNYISVVDEWAAIEAADPPVVVIDMYGTDKAGYQLGGGKKSTRKVDLHIFASDPAERNDIVEALYDGTFNKSISILDLPTGSVLDYDGTFYGRRELDERYSAETDWTLIPDNKLTYLFDRRLINNVSRLHFDAVTSRHVNLPLIMTQGRDEVMLSDLNAYRSKVSFDLFSWDDRTTGRSYD
jgi:hypothetical protein